jgi:hypothetical protein
MAEERERAAHLLINEMAVPGKLRDAGHPAYAAGNPGDGEKADQNLRTLTGGNTAKAARLIRMHRARRRRLETRVFNACLQLARHQVRQVGGIGEERKNEFHRIWHPLARFKTLRHEFDGIACGKKLMAGKKSAGNCGKGYVDRSAGYLPAGGKKRNLKKLVGQQNRVDHMNDAVGLIHVSNGDGRSAAFFIGKDELAHLH